MKYQHFLLMALLLLAVSAASAQQGVILNVDNVYYNQGDVHIEVMQGFWVDWHFYESPGVYCCGTGQYIIEAVGGETNRFIITQGDRTLDTWEYVVYDPNGGYDIINLSLPPDPNHVHRDNL